ncbi:MAG: LCP family protein [Clostridia bacterium]|nr:LCP family protein [Clostridia bacterium]
MGRYDDGFDNNLPFDQDKAVDYYEIYKEYQRENESGRDIRSHSKRRSESIDINSFSGKRRTSAEKKGAKKRTKKNKRKKIIIITACVLIILGILLYFAWPFLNYNYNKLKGNNKDLGFSDVIDEKVINIGLFGLDTREEKEFKGRSDSIMILSINTETKKVKVISLMRDTITRIEHKGEVFYTKLNNAYAYGGPELAIKTINQTYGLDISRYATINFYGMVDIIDAVGGIEATITEDELAWHGNDNPNLNGCMEEICTGRGLDVSKYRIYNTGKMHLNGVQAVAYARVRHGLSIFGTNDDYGRTDRQRYVMEQLFTKAINLKKSDYYKLAKALLPCSETSLTYNDIVTLAVNVLLKGAKFEQYRIPQMEWLMPFGYPEYGSCVYFDKDYAKRAVHAIIYDDITMEAFEEANPIEKNDWFAEIYGSPSITPAPDLPSGIEETVESETYSSTETSVYESSSETSVYESSSETSPYEEGTETGTEDNSASSGGAEIETYSEGE